MKIFTPFLVFIILNLNARSQILEPVKWKFTKTKIDNKTYKLFLKATVDPGWHLYSQTQPISAVAVPLQITFTKNNAISVEGKPKEVGKISKVFDKSLGIGAYQYSNNLNITQIVKLKKVIKTSIKGFVTYQVCNSHQCLPPQDEYFTIVLN